MRDFRVSCHELTCAKATQTRIGIFKTNEENEKFKNLDGVSSNASPVEWAAERKSSHYVS